MSFRSVIKSYADYYDALELSEGATPEEVREAFYACALRYHPDRNPDDSHATEKFKAACEAYTILREHAAPASVSQPGAAFVPLHRMPAEKAAAKKIGSLKRDLFLQLQPLRGSDQHIAKADTCLIRIIHCAHAGGYDASEDIGDVISAFAALKMREVRKARLHISTDDMLKKIDRYAAAAGCSMHYILSELWKAVHEHSPSPALDPVVRDAVEQIRGELHDLSLRFSVSIAALTRNLWEAFSEPEQKDIVLRHFGSLVQTALDQIFRLGRTYGFDTRGCIAEIMTLYCDQMLEESRNADFLIVDRFLKEMQSLSDTYEFDSSFYMNSILSEFLQQHAGKAQSGSVESKKQYLHYVDYFEKQYRHFHAASKKIRASLTAHNREIKHISYVIRMKLFR